MPFAVFVNGVMRSVGGHWAVEDAEVVLVDLDQAGSVAAANDAGKSEFLDLLGRMRALLAHDPEALGILNGLATGSTRMEIQARVGINETTYDTGRRRMTRLLAKAFGQERKDKL
jgi:hypothetical protein